MPTNNFLQFATADGAVVESDAAYAGDAARLVGFQNGVADPAHVNKVWRQGAAGSAALFQIVVDHLNVDANDDGNTTNQKANLRAAIAQMLSGVYFGQDTSSTANVLTVALDPAPVNLNNFRAVWVRVANNNTGPVTLNLSPLGAKTVTRRDGSPLQARDLKAGQFTHLVYDSQLGQFVLAGAAGSEVVTLPTADVTLYVSTSGNDSTADGTQAKPFLTPLAAAMFASRRFYFAGYKLFLQLATPGSYTGPGNLPAIGGIVTIVGDPANPQNYVLIGSSTANGQSVVGASSGCNILLSGVTVQVSNSGMHGIGSSGGGSVGATNTNFQSSVSGLAFAFSGPGGNTVIGSNCTFSGAMSWMWYANTGSIVQSGNVTVPNGAVFSAATVAANANGSIAQSQSGLTIAQGTVTGVRYSATLNGTIQSNNGSATYFPGSAAGTTASGGQYA